MKKNEAIKAFEIIKNKAESEPHPELNEMIELINTTHRQKK